MKKLVLVLLFAFLGINVNAQEKPNKNKKAQVEVNGVCEMCKKRIEQAAFSVKGVKSADWHIDDHILHLIINEEKCSPIDVASKNTWSSTPAGACAMRLLIASATKSRGDKSSCR